MAATDDQRWQATADRVELAELMHRYALAIDTAQFEDLREVFTPDASVDFGSVDQYVEGALKDAFGKYRDRLVFLDFITDQKENVWPMVKAGKGLTEMLLGSEDL